MSQASRPPSLRHWLLIHCNIYALLLPSFVQLMLMKRLHPPTMMVAVSGILAIFANVALGVLSSKYGITKPLHEAGASVFTVYVAFGCLTNPPSWSKSGPFPYIFMICVVPIVMIVWNAALSLAGWARSENPGARLPTCVGEYKDDGMHKERPLAP
ncbi:hypothetical protein C8R47DRAFT_609583 [Mycena vitilis]|nr:hypothetical protein C8R47DRAFT_609583 [Mycena vitilis]